MDGLDLQDISHHWLVLPASRRFLGVRRAVTGRFGAYLFLPFDIGPSLEWDDCWVTELPRLAARDRPSLRLIDSVEDVRPLEENGDWVQSLCSVARFLGMPFKLGGPFPRQGVQAMVAAPVHSLLGVRSGYEGHAGADCR